MSQNYCLYFGLFLLFSTAQAHMNLYLNQHEVMRLLGKLRFPHLCFTILFKKQFVVVLYKHNLKVHFHIERTDGLLLLTIPFLKYKFLSSFVYRVVILRRKKKSWKMFVLAPRDIFSSSSVSTLRIFVFSFWEVCAINSIAFYQIRGISRRISGLSCYGVVFP